MVREILKRGFMRWYPESFVITAHVGGAIICILMQRWDLLIAGLAFGIPSALLFFDLLPGGKGFIIKFLKWALRL
jgi:hypothetical protein